MYRYLILKTRIAIMDFYNINFELKKKTTFLNILYDIFLYKKDIEDFHKKFSLFSNFSQM